MGPPGYIWEPLDYLRPPGTFGTHRTFWHPHTGPLAPTYRTFWDPLDLFGTPELFGSPRFFSGPLNLGPAGFIWKPRDFLRNPGTYLGPPGLFRAPETYLGPP